MRKVDLTGQTFGKLTVLAEHPVRKNRHIYWMCLCACGNKKIICARSLSSGSAKSCGCGVAASNIARSDHGMTRTSEHGIWRQMIGRCTNEKLPGFYKYGGRGIKVCHRWQESFQAFLADVGPRPSVAHSLDRRNNDGHYEPDNVRWATRSEQNRNTRTSKIWMIGDLRFESASDAAAHFGVDAAAISNWCNGYTSDRRTYPPRPGCRSEYRYGGMP